MTRLQRFEGFSKDPGLCKLFKRLSAADRKACVDFIEQHDELDHNGFALAVNRWLLGQPKPKRFTDMWALVLQSNGVGAIHRQR